MKNYFSHRSLVCVLSLLSFVGMYGAQEINESLRFIHFPNSERVAELTQHNEFYRSEAGVDKNIHCNSLLVNGEASDYPLVGPYRL